MNSNNDQMMHRFIPNDLYDFRDKKGSLYNHLSYMLARTQRIFEYEGLPDTIPARILELYMQLHGYVGIFKYEGNMYACFGGLGGEPDYNYMPTVFTVANPALKYSANLRIHDECAIIPNDSMYTGLLPLFSKYGTALIENELSMNLVSIMTRVQSLISASDDRVKESAVQYLKRVFDGDLGIIGDLSMMENLKVQPYATSSANSQLKTLIEYEQYLKASEFNELGLDANYNMKRETLTDSENEMNRDSLKPFIDDMLECRQAGIDEVNKLFGTNISVRYASAWKDNEEELELQHEIMEAEAEADQVIEEDQEEMEGSEDDSEKESN